MSNQILSYKDLLAEKEMLQSRLKEQKKALRENVDKMMGTLEPLQSVISLAGKLTARDNSNIFLNAGVDKLIDLIIKKLLLSKAGWITRLVVPFFLKNYSSHFISENKDTILNMLFSWFGKKNVNGEEKVEAE